MFFDGRTYEPRQDEDRLSKQLDRVKKLMLDGRWRTIAAIHRIVGGSEAGVSARLRDLRKERFGAFQVQRRAVTGLRQKGCFEYRINID
jgi:hypothetical protein